jgi:hypothetical protein
MNFSQVIEESRLGPPVYRGPSALESSFQVLSRSLNLPQHMKHGAETVQRGHLSRPVPRLACHRQCLSEEWFGLDGTPLTKVGLTGQDERCQLKDPIIRRTRQPEALA